MRGIIIKHTLVDRFDGVDVHARPELLPNTEVEITGGKTVFGISYVKIKTADGIEGFVDADTIITVK